MHDCYCRPAELGLQQITFLQKNILPLHSDKNIYYSLLNSLTIDLSLLYYTHISSVLLSLFLNFDVTAHCF